MLKKIFAVLSVFTVFALSSDRVMMTPMEYVFSKSGKAPFQSYSSYFVSKKLGGNASKFKAILAKRGGNLGYYEGILKSLYYSSFGGKDFEEYWKKLIDILYESSLTRIMDSYEGVFIQDLLMKKGDFQKAVNVFESPYFCSVLHKEIDRRGCALNQIALRCILDGKLYDIAHLFDFNEEEIDYVSRYCRSNISGK